MRLPAIILHDHFNDESQSYKTDLDEKERLNRDKHIPRIALNIYKYSSYKYLYLSGASQALFNATRNDHSSFNTLTTA